MATAITTTCRSAGQNPSVLPFVVENPRIVSTSFLSEGLSLPGYLYLRSPATIAVVTLVAALGCVGFVFVMARRLGRSVAAATGRVAWMKFTFWLGDSCKDVPLPRRCAIEGIKGRKALQ